MGYRSNGGMVIFGPKDKMIAHLTALRMTQTDRAPWEIEEVETYELGDNLVWRLEYISWRWYDGYPDIKEFERIYSESKNAQDQGINGFRWRFGEDDDDTECAQFGDADAGFHLERSAHDNLGPP